MHAATGERQDAWEYPTYDPGYLRRAREQQPRRSSLQQLPSDRHTRGRPGAVSFQEREDESHYIPVKFGFRRWWKKRRRVCLVCRTVHAHCCLRLSQGAASHCHVLSITAVCTTVSLIGTPICIQYVGYLCDVMRCIRSPDQQLPVVRMLACLSHTQTRSACSAACMRHHVAQTAVTSLDFDFLLEQQLPVLFGKPMLQVLRCVFASFGYSHIA